MQHNCSVTMFNTGLFEIKVSPTGLIPATIITSCHNYLRILWRILTYISCTVTVSVTHEANAWNREYAQIGLVANSQFILLEG